VRAYPEPTGFHMPAARTAVVAPPAPTVLFAIPSGEREQYSGNQFTRLYAHTTGDALRALSQNAPRLVVVDWDEQQVDAGELCRAAGKLPATSMLVTTGEVGHAPLAIKAGAHAILLKPFAPSLLAARIGRTLRETATIRGFRQPGPNRAWPQVACPQCSTGGAVSFDFSSHRRMWLACLGCDHTWLGARLE
jgi:DNA-binding response OmpR family regulator